MNNLFELLYQFGIILALALILIQVSGIIVGQLEYLTRVTKTQSFGLAAILAALSTSLPELIVSITSAFNGRNELTLGNIMGSNIANISLVVGLAALIGGMVKGTGTIIKREVFYAFLAGTAPVLFLLDGSLSRFDGLALLLIYIMFVIKELINPSVKKEVSAKKNRRVSALHRWANAKVERHLLLFLASIGIMIGAAELLVITSTNLANAAQVPIFIIGLFVISIGTTLPELVFEIQAIRRKESSLAFGNIIGSIVANSTLILGVSAYIHPITLMNDKSSYLLSILGFIVIFGLFWNFTRTKQRLDRKEGLVLVAAYIVFAAVQYLSVH